MEGPDEPRPPSLKRHKSHQGIDAVDVAAVEVQRAWICSGDESHRVGDSATCVCGAIVLQKCVVCNQVIDRRTAFVKHVESQVHRLCSERGRPLLVRCPKKHSAAFFSLVKEVCTICEESLERKCPLCNCWLKSAFRDFGTHFANLHRPPGSGGMVNSESPMRRRLEREKVEDEWVEEDGEFDLDIELEGDQEEEEEDESRRQVMKSLAKIPTSLVLAPNMILGDAVWNVLQHSYGRLVSCKWIVWCLLQAGWAARFGDFCDAGKKFELTKCSDPGVLERFVHACVSRDSSIVRTNQKYVVWYSLPFEEAVLRHDLVALYDELSPLVNERFSSEELHRLFAEHQVSASLLLKWRNGTPEERLKLSFPTELAIDVVARTLRVKFRGTVLTLLSDEKRQRDMEWEDDEWVDDDAPNDELVADNFFVEEVDGMLVLYSWRRLFVQEIAPEDRRLALEARVLSMVEQFALSKSSATFALCMTALYEPLLNLRARDVFRRQFFESAMNELHCDERQMILFSRNACEPSNFLFEPESLPALFRLRRTAPRSRSVRLLQVVNQVPMEVYRQMQKNLKKRGGKLSYALMRQDEICLSFGQGKNHPTRILFRVKLPIEPPHPLWCLSATLNVVGQGEGESLNFSLLGSHQLRLCLSRKVNGEETTADPSTHLALDRWNDTGAVLLVQGGFLIGRGFLAGGNSTDTGKKKWLALQVFLNNELLSEAMLRITSKFRSIDLVGQPVLDDFCHPDRLRELASGQRPNAEPSDEFPEPSGPAQDPVVAPEVGRFVLEVGWQMHQGWRANKVVRSSLFAKDLVSISAALQAIMEEEIFSIAADMLEAEKNRK